MAEGFLPFTKLYSYRNKPKSVRKFVRKLHNFLIYSLYCGDGEIRTLVQTRNQYAFYTLIPELVFVKMQAPNRQQNAYPVKFQSSSREPVLQSSIFLAPPYRNVSKRGNRVMSRFCHCGRNKANLLYFG